MKFLDVLTSAFSSNPISTILDKVFPDKKDKMAFEMQLKELLFKETELYIKDLENARDLQKTALNQSDIFSKRFLYYLTIAIIGNSILAGILSFTVQFPPENKELVMMYYSFSFIIGGSQIMRFFYGNQQSNNNNQNQN